MKKGIQVLVNGSYGIVRKIQKDMILVSFFGGKTCSYPIDVVEVV